VFPFNINRTSDYQLEWGVFMDGWTMYACMVIDPVVFHRCKLDQHHLRGWSFLGIMNQSPLSSWMNFECRQTWHRACVQS
jgi:hypothetical protein